MNPGDFAVVSETVITADGDVVTFSNGEDANCVLVGLTIAGTNNGDVINIGAFGGTPEASKSP